MYFLCRVRVHERTQERKCSCILYVCVQECVAFSKIQKMRKPRERMNIIVWMKHPHTQHTRTQREIGTPLCNTAGDKMRPGNNRKEVIQTHTHIHTHWHRHG